MPAGSCRPGALRHAVDYPHGALGGLELRLQHERGTAVAPRRASARQTSDNLTLPGSGSQKATDLLNKRFPIQANGTNPVVMKAPGGAKLADKKYADAVDATVKSLKKSPQVASAVSPLSKSGKNFLSKDGRIGYISLTLHDSPSQLSTDEAHDIIDAESPASDAGLKVATGGYLGQKVSKPSTHGSEAVGIPPAIIVLLVTFGTGVP